MKVDSILTLDTTELTRKDWRRLFEACTFEDKDGTLIQAFDHQPTAERVLLPRGAIDLIPNYVERVDMRCRPKMPKMEHVKQLDAGDFKGQRAAVQAMVKHEQGQVRLPTGVGKTTIGLAFVAGCATRTLVLVHTRDLLNQWVARAEEEIPGIDVGVIGGGRNSVGHLTVGLVQSVKKELPSGRKFWRQFGCVVIDESHHAAAETYEWLLNVCPAYYRFGLSASDRRSDGRERLVRYSIGPIIYRMPFRSQVPIEVQPVFTPFRSSYSANFYMRLVAQLVRDDDRNQLIADVTARQVRKGNSVLVLSRQINHLERIAERLPADLEGHYAIVTGRLRAAERTRLIEGLREGSLSCILGTQIFEEGVDVPRLNRVVLAFPGTDVTTLQKVGRATRSFAGKTMSVVIDVVDPDVPVLKRQWGERKHWYEKTARIHIRRIVDARRSQDGKEEVDWSEPEARRRVLDRFRGRNRSGTAAA